MMKKRFIVVLVTVVSFVCLLLASCSYQSHFSYTFNIENGDCVEVQCDTTDGYNIFQTDGTFTIIDKSKSEIATGSFLLADDVGWQKAIDDINSYIAQGLANVVSGSLESGTCIVAFPSASYYLYVSKVPDTKTAVSVKANSQQDLEKAIGLLLIETSHEAPPTEDEADMFRD